MANIILNGENLKAFVLTLAQHNTVSLSQKNYARKMVEKASKLEWKTKLSLHMKWYYLKNPKDFTKTLLELINELSRLVENRIDIY